MVDNVPAVASSTLLVGGDWSLSELWTGFAQFTQVNEQPPDRYTWSGERLTKIQATSRDDDFCPKIWSCMSIAPKQEHLQWSIEKPKADNAGILFHPSV